MTWTEPPDYVGERLRGHLIRKWEEPVAGRDEIMHVPAELLRDLQSTLEAGDRLARALAAAGFDAEKVLRFPDVRSGRPSSFRDAMDQLAYWLPKEADPRTETA